MILWLPATPAQAQSGGNTLVDIPQNGGLTDEDSKNPTAEIIQKYKQQLDSASLPPDIKEEAGRLFDQALDQLKVAETHSKAIAERRKMQNDAPREILLLKSRLADPAAKLELEFPADASIADLQQLLADNRQQLTQAEEKGERLKQEPLRRNDRRIVATQLQQAARDRIAKCEELLKARPAPDMAAELILATKTLQRAIRHASKLEIEFLDAELLAYDATAELIDLQEQQTMQTLSVLKKNVTSLNEMVAQRRQMEAEQKARQARIAAAHAHPILQPTALENLTLIEMRLGPEGLAAKIKTVSEELKKVEGSLSFVHELERELKEKLDLSGMAPSSAQLLLQARSELPRVSDLQRQAYLRRQTIAEARFQLADVRFKKSHLDDLSDELKTLENQTNSLATDQERDQLTEAFRVLLGRQRDLLKDLEDDYTAYFNLLNELNAKEQELLTTSKTVERLVEEHLLWVRAHGIFRWENLRRAGEALTWLTLLKNWEGVGRDAWQALKTRFLLCISSFLLFIGLAIGHHSFYRKLRLLGEEAAKSTLIPFRTSLWALWLTILLTMLWPSLVFGLGWSLYSSLDATEFTRAVGAGMLLSGGVYIALELTRRLLSPHGLAESHFRWTDRRLRLLRRHLAWLTLCLFPLVFLAGHIHWEGNASREDSLGRLIFALGMVLLSIFLQRVLRPLPSSNTGLIPTQAMVKKITYWSAVGVPLFVAGLSLVGFHFTAVQLSFRIFATLGLALGMLVIHGLAARWLWLVRGQLAMQNKNRLKHAQEHGDKTQARMPKDSPEANAEINLPMVNRQTRQMLRTFLAVTAVTGVWLIWLDVLPGNQYLLNRPLWSSAPQVNAISADSTLDHALTDSNAVTVADLVLAILVVLIAVQVSRNVPGLVEVGSPLSAKLDAGARYALTTIIRYVLIAAAIGVATSIIGIGWSRVQWLVAALSVGVGFGLQELVGNFISGVILLFERPVRVGDIITFDGVTGVVTRVQIRATTVRNWDQQDYLIPNKDLITGRVLNWTLSGELNRIVIEVGVGFRSDPHEVREALFEILGEYETILKNPKPLVTFEGFGDSTLNFVVRAYLAELEGRIEMIHELHSKIHDRFREKGIEIAFPQRDITIRNLQTDRQSSIDQLSQIGNLTGEDS